MSGDELAGEGVSRSSTIGSWLGGVEEEEDSEFGFDRSLGFDEEEAEEDGDEPTTFKKAALPTRCRSADQVDSIRTLSFSMFFRFSS